jgi:hypothetical protein
MKAVQASEPVTPANTTLYASGAKSNRFVWAVTKMGRFMESAAIFHINLAIAMAADPIQTAGHALVL